MTKAKMPVEKHKMIRVIDMRSGQVRTEQMTYHTASVATSASSRLIRTVPRARSVAVGDL